MNIPTLTSNVIKLLIFPLSLNFKFRNTFFQLLHFNVDDEIESTLRFNKQLHSHDTRSYNQMSILCLNNYAIHNIESFTKV